MILLKRFLKEKLKISNDKLDIEPTKNGYNFLGKGRGGLDLVLDLCKRSVPVKGDAGFFFYQTKSGFKFKSINELVSQKPEFTLYILVDLNKIIHKMVVMTIKL